MSAREGEIEWHEQRLSELEGDVDAARECKSWQALAALQRQVTQAGKDLFEVRAAGGVGAGELDDLDPEEYIAQLEISAREWPARHLQLVTSVYLEIENLPSLDDLVAAYQEHHGHLRLVEG